MPDSTETIAAGNPHGLDGRRGPTWRGWVLSILAAILLSVAATLLLGGSGVFRSDRAISPAAGHSGFGVGSGCCPPAGAGK
ncbi:MAG: hypothetical protein ACYC24_04615 [Desulfobacteria bacterium]